MDTRAIDKQYKPFLSFSEWMRCPVDHARWARAVEKLEAYAVSPDLLQRARNVVKRAAAVDTGALEALYDVDRGFTFTVAFELATWESAVAQKGPKAQALIRSQLEAYERVVDLATGAVPISEAWIRELHRELCEAQQTYSVYTELGIQELPLPVGKYKSQPNHVRRRDGELHAYCPVDLTPAEMHRLCEEMSTAAFLDAGPVLQASYVHYAFVVIHPFADGNGRVARALASVFFCRAISVPFLLLADMREEYLSSLEAADAGQYQRFVDFVFQRGLEAIRLIEDSFESTEAGEPKDAWQAIAQMYITSGGLTHQQIDEIGLRLFDAVHKEMAEKIGQLSREMADRPQVRPNVSGHGVNDYRPSRPSHRLPIGDKARRLVFELRTPAPANVHLRKTFVLEVPRDGRTDDPVLLRSESDAATFEASIAELTPATRTIVLLRIRLFVERTLTKALQELAAMTSTALREFRDS